MKNVAWIAVIFLSTFVACNYTEGQCYYLGEDGTGVGVGGGVIVTNGAGGFGNVPPEPQGVDDLPPPDCNIATQSPCYQKCQANYEDAAAVCGKIENEAARKTCQENAFAIYDSCRATCKKQENKDCDDKYQDCIDNGPSSCLNKVAGKTLCYRCWERCNAGDSPSDQCRQCKF